MEASGKNNVCDFLTEKEKLKLIVQQKFTCWKFILFLCIVEKSSTCGEKYSVPKTVAFTSYLTIILPQNHIFLPVSLLHTYVSCYPLFSWCPLSH